MPSRAVPRSMTTLINKRQLHIKIYKKYYYKVDEIESALVLPIITKYRL